MAEMNWQRVRELFDAALERAEAERVDWLVRECGGDEAVRAQVEKLLRAHDDAGEFIEQPKLAQLAEQTTRELTGQRVGAYQFVRELGRGGMGVVYLAERADGEFHKQVAIKLLTKTADEDVTQRFRRERQILADLEHPNIARLLDGGTFDGQPFVVMEFVPGQSLRQQLRERGTLPLEEIKAIVQQVCSGLAEAHERGIVHRDIKPENLIVTGHHGQPHVKILDFGIAKLQQSTATAQTHDSVILGTPSYMSPEQAAGRGVAEIDLRSDVYSLGIVIYEMLTGAPAFRGDSYVSVINQHLHARPASPHKSHPELAIPPAVSKVVLKALAKDPGARYQSARQLAEEFAHASGGVRAGRSAMRLRLAEKFASASSSRRRSLWIRWGLPIIVLLMVSFTYFVFDFQYSGINRVYKLIIDIGERRVIDIKERPVSYVLLIGLAITILSVVYFNSEKLYYFWGRLLSRIRESERGSAGIPLRRQDHNNRPENPAIETSVSDRSPLNSVIVGCDTVVLNSMAPFPLVSDCQALTATFPIELSESDKNGKRILEKFILNSDYQHIWKSLADARRLGRILLTGYGSFGGSSLLKCAAAKAKEELKNRNQMVDVLFVLFLNITNETEDNFAVEATYLGLEGASFKDASFGLRKAENVLSHITDGFQSSQFEVIPLDELHPAFFITMGIKSTAMLRTQAQMLKVDYAAAEMISDINNLLANHKNAKSLHQILNDILNSKKINSKVVLIVDGVKYLNTLEKLSKSSLFNNQHVDLISVTRQEYVDRWEDAKLRLKRLGFDDPWYSPSLWNTNWMQLFLDSPDGSEWHHDPACKTFLKHLEYKGRGSVGYYIKELRNPRHTFFDNGRGLINFSDANVKERDEVIHNAWMQTLLDLNWNIILGNRFGGREERKNKDRARHGVYELLDWIASYDASSLTWRQIIKSSLSQCVTISPDRSRNEEVIASLLQVLTDAKYISEDRGRYRITWNSTTPLPVETFDKMNAPMRIRRESTITNKKSNKRSKHPSTSAEIEEEQKVRNEPAATQVVLTESEVMLKVEPELVIQEVKQVFVSYSHLDLGWLKKLQTHLRPLEREGTVNVWSDNKIKPGDKWEEEIQKALMSAKVAILLVSANFLASKFITECELPSLLESTESRGTKIIPVIVSDCLFDESDLSQFQAVNVARPLANLSQAQQQKELANIARSVKNALSG